MPEDPKRSARPEGESGKAEDLKLDPMIADIPEETKEYLRSLPADERERQIKYLVESKKNFQSAADKDRQSVKSREQELTRSEENLKKQEELLKQIKQVDAKPTDAAKDKLLDRLIASATDAETREGLTNLKSILREENSTVSDALDSLQKKIDGLEVKTADLESLGTMSLTSKIEGDLSKLRVEVGKDLIDQYQEKYRVMAEKYPNANPEEVLVNVSSFKEVRDASNKQSQVIEQKETERRARSSEPEFKSSVALPDYERDKQGRVTPASVSRRVMEIARGQGVQP